MKYQLPCSHCDQILLVSVTDAGRELQCSGCGQSVKAPSLGNIKKLEPVAGTEKRSARKAWSTLQGLAFGLGIILLVVGASASVLYAPKYLAANKELSKLLESTDGKMPDFEDRSKIEEQMKKVPVPQLWDQWRTALQVNTDKWQPTEARLIYDSVQNFRQSLIIYVGIAVLGVILMVVSIFLP